MDNSNTVPYPSPSEPLSSAEQATTVLQQGLAALQQKDFGRAIAHLEPVYQSATSPALRLKAQVGLVKAHHHLGNWQEAIAYCQPLCDSTNPQIQQWATQVMQTLHQRQVSVATDVPTTSEPEASSRLGLRYAGRAQKWTALAPINRTESWLVQGGTAIALVAILWFLVKTAFSLTNFLAANIGWLQRFLYYGNPLIWIGLALVGVFLILPGWLDRILHQRYGATPLSLEELGRSSPESMRLLRRLCTPKRLPLPRLMVLPIAAPVSLTYGNGLQASRIVISQGALEQLRDDETATLYARELAHLQSKDFAVLSLVTLVSQLPFLLYWQGAVWGDRQSDRVLQSIARVVSGVGYALYWLLRWVGLGLSRWRVEGSDRVACQITGNPNGLIRALIKSASGTVQTIQQIGYTPPLLESFALLTPVSPELSLLWSAPEFALNSFCWEQHSPYRNWLLLNNSHPTMGDRLQHLCRYAQQWRLPVELDLPAAVTTRPAHRRDRWLQFAPWLGIAVGGAIALGLWAFGALANQMEWLSLDWMQGDRSLLWGWLWIGFGIGMVVRINHLFPDNLSSQQWDEARVAELLADPRRLPVQGQPLRLSGTVLGRKGIANQWNQDWLLQTQTGLLKLRHAPSLATLGKLIPRSQRLGTYHNQSVTISGWLRRGATPWVEIDRLQTRGVTIEGGSPMMTTLAAVGAALLGVLLILQGG